MKTKLKRGISAILIILMILTLIPSGVFAAKIRKPKNLQKPKNNIPISEVSKLNFEKDTYLDVMANIDDYFSYWEIKDEWGINDESAKEKIWTKSGIEKIWKSNKNKYEFKIYQVDCIKCLEEGKRTYRFSDYERDGWCREKHKDDNRITITILYVKDKNDKIGFNFVDKNRIGKIKKHVKEDPYHELKISDGYKPPKYKYYRGSTNAKSYITYGHTWKEMQKYKKKNYYYIYKRQALVIQSSNVIIEFDITRGKETRNKKKVKGYLKRPYLKTASTRIIKVMQSKGKMTGDDRRAPAKVRVENRSYTSNRIKWNKGTKAAGYNVYVKGSGETTYKKIRTVKNTKKTSYSIVHSGLEYGKVYNYRVKGYTLTKDNKQKEYSKFKTRSIKTRVAQTKRLKLKKVGKNKKNVKITFNKGIDVTGYEIERKQVGKKKYKKIKTTSKTKFIDKKVKKGKKYRYRIRAYKKVGDKIYYGKYSISRLIML